MTQSLQVNPGEMQKRNNRREILIGEHALQLIQLKGNCQAHKSLFAD